MQRIYLGTMFNCSKRIVLISWGYWLDGKDTNSESENENVFSIQFICIKY